MKLLGLEVCADTIVGDQLLRGISGGQKKRVTSGESPFWLAMLSPNSSADAFPHCYSPTAEAMQLLLAVNMSPAQQSSRKLLKRM